MNPNLSDIYAVPERKPVHSCHYTTEPDDAERMRLEAADWLSSGYTVVTTTKENVVKMEVFTPITLNGNPMYGACSIYSEDEGLIGQFGSYVVQRFKDYSIFVVGSNDAQKLSGKLNVKLQLYMEASASNQEEVISYVRDYAGMQPIPIDAV